MGEAGKDLAGDADAKTWFLLSGLSRAVRKEDSAQTASLEIPTSDLGTDIICHECRHVNKRIFLSGEKMKAKFIHVK